MLKLSDISELPLSGWWEISGFKVGRVCRYVPCMIAGSCLWLSCQHSINEVSVSYLKIIYENKQTRGGGVVGALKVC